MNVTTIVITVLIVCALASSALSFYLLWHVGQWQEYTSIVTDMYEEESTDYARCHDTMIRINTSAMDTVITLLYKYSEKEYINRTEAELNGIEPYTCGHKTCDFVQEAREEGLHMGWSRWESKNSTAAHATAVWILFPDPTSGGFLNESSWDLDAIRIVNGTYFGGLELDYWEDDYCD